MYVSLQIILALLNFMVIIAAIPSSFRHARQDNFTWLPPNMSTVQQELGHRLSKNASIYFPGSPDYANATEWWAVNDSPRFSIVVVPGVDRDIAVTVS